MSFKDYLKEKQKYIDNNDMETDYIPKTSAQAFRAWKDKTLQVRDHKGNWGWVVGGRSTL